MAKRKSAANPLQPEDRDALLNAVRRADEPLDAGKVAKAAATSRRPNVDEAVAILDGFVAAGALKSFPPKTAKGKTRYWDREPRSVARQQLLEIVERAEEPISARDAKRRLKLPFRLSDAEIDSILQESAQEGRIYTIPGKTLKSGPRYWHDNDLEFARRLVLDLLNTKGPQTQSALKRPVKWLDDGQRRRLMEALVESRTIYRHPALGSSKKVVFGTRPPAPGPYFKETTKQLTKVVQALRAAEVPEIELRRAVVQAIESAGVQLAGTTAVTSGQGPAEATQPAARPVDLVSLMKQIEPGAERGALVTVRSLRRSANLNKPDFDSLALELARRGTVVLHRHDFPSSLTPQERDELVTDGNENYYVGLALRPMQGAR